MEVGPRPPRERVITPRMWRDILAVGIVMAVATLFVLDASLPGRAGRGVGRPAVRTMAFTTLMLLQLFNVFNARSEEQSAFAGLLSNRWLWAAVGLSLLLQMVVLYLPPLQRAFGTVALDAGDWLRCVAVASLVLWVAEAGKFLRRQPRRRGASQEE